MRPSQVVSRSLRIGGCLLLLAQSSLLAQQPVVTTGFAAVNGTKLYYEMSGEGHPLILIHGGGVDRRMWDDQFQSFARRYKVIRYDQRGAGKSEVPQERFSNVDDLLGLLRFLEIEQAYLLGLSRGGGIAANFTLEHPGMVDALILASSNLGRMPEAYLKLFAKMFSTARDEGVGPALDVWLGDPYQAPGKEHVAAREQFRTIVADNLVVNLLLLYDTRLVRRPDVPVSQRLPEIRVPTLILSGARDHPQARTNADRTEAAIPNATKVRLPGAAHLVNVDQPEPFNRAVLKFLSALTRK